MKTCVLASGSEGNVTYVETEHHKILLDIGMTVKYITEKLSELSINPEDIDHVFITHVHDDHVKALKQFIKKYKPTICVSPLILAELEVLKEHLNDIPLYLTYVTRYGDEKALPALLEIISLQSINYVDFNELKFAIELFGGEYKEKRDFSSDLYYKRIKGSKDETSSN